MATTLLDSKSLWLEQAFLSESLSLYAHLVTAIAWDERIRARKAMSFGQPYNYSGTVWPPCAFPDVLVPVLERVAARLGYQPNNCLANYYPEGSSTMGYHSDAVAGLAPGTGIAIVSLGAERVLSFRNQQDKQQVEHYLLKSGSLLFMSLDMQLAWKHAILPTEGVEGRISLTFRRLQQPTEPKA